MRAEYITPLARAMLGLELKRYFSWFRVMVRSFLLTLAGAVAMFAVAMAFYLQEQNSRQQSLVHEASMHASIQKNVFAHELRTVAQGLLFLSDQSGLHESFSSEGGREQIIQDFVSLVLSSGNFDQIRLLDLQGMETVRVNFRHGQTEIASADQLQDKSDRYYFREMQKLTDNQLYYSALDLNREHGKVEIPHKPTIRFGMPVYEKDGRKVGYVIVNYLAKSMLSRFRELANMLQSDALLLDSEGFVISAPDSDIEWSNEHNEAAYFPAVGAQDLWQEMLEQDEGALEAASGTYVHASVYPDQELVSIPAFHGMSLNKGYFWKVMVRIDENLVGSVMQPYRELIKSWFAMAVLVLLLFSLPAGYLLERRRILQNHIDMLLQAIEFAGEAIMVTDLKGRIEYVNPAFCKLSGYSVEEVVDKNPSEIIKSKAQGPEFYRDLWETISAGKPWSGHLVDRRKDGSLLPLLMSITPIVDQGGRIVRYMAVQRDYTDQKLLQDKLAQEQKMQSLSVAVGGVAHEFNNILAAMMGNTYLVKNIEKENPDVIAKLNAIERLGNKAAGMIRQMLAYVGRAEVSLRTYQLGDFFSQAVNHCQKTVPECVNIKADMPALAVSIEADLVQLQTVVDHLIFNACDAVREVGHGEIRVSLERIEHSRDGGKPMPFVCFSVHDSGGGISDEHMPLLFEPFFTTKEVGKGTGLGLSTVHGIVQKHHGYIEVESETGKGALFSVYLPLLPSDKE